MPRHLAAIIQKQMTISVPEPQRNRNKYPHCVFLISKNMIFVQQGAKRGVQLGRKGMSSKEDTAKAYQAAASLPLCQDQKGTTHSAKPALSRGMTLLLGLLNSWANQSLYRR